MKHSNRVYLLAGIFFALCAYYYLSSSISALLFILRFHPADPWGLFLSLLPPLVTRDLPYLLLALYCFFLRRKKAAPWVFATAFVLMIIFSVTEVIRAETYPVHHSVALSNGLFGLFAIALLLAKFLGGKALFVLSGGLLLCWNAFDIWWNFIGDAPNYYDPLIVAIACLAVLYFLARLAAYGVLWWQEGGRQLAKNKKR